MVMSIISLSSSHLGYDMITCSSSSTSPKLQNECSCKMFTVHVKKFAVFLKNASSVAYSCGLILKLWYFSSMKKSPKSSKQFSNSKFFWAYFMFSACPHYFVSFTVYHIDQYSLMTMHLTNSKQTSDQSANLSGHCQQTVTQCLSTLLIPKFFFITAQWDFLCTLNRCEMMLFHCKHNPMCDVATVVRLATRSLGVLLQ